VDFVLDDAIPVAQVDALADVSVQFFVGGKIEFLVLSLIFQLHQTGKQVGIDKLKERVHVDKVLFRKREHLVEGFAVQVLARGAGHAVKAVVGHPHVFVPVNLEEIAPLRVDNETARPVAVVVFKIQNGFGITKAFDEFLLGPVKGQAVKRGLFVLCQCVVHIETDGFDTFQFQFAIAKNVIGRDESIGWKFPREFHEIFWESDFTKKLLIAMVDLVTIRSCGSNFFFV